MSCNTCINCKWYKVEYSPYIKQCVPCCVNEFVIKHNYVGGCKYHERKDKDIGVKDGRN